MKSQIFGFAIILSLLTATTAMAQQNMAGNTLKTVYEKRFVGANNLWVRHIYTTNPDEANGVFADARVAYYLFSQPTPDSRAIVRCSVVAPQQGAFSFLAADSCPATLPWPLSPPLKVVGSGIQGYVMTRQTPGTAALMHFLNAGRGFDNRYLTNRAEVEPGYMAGSSGTLGYVVPRDDASLPPITSRSICTLRSVAVENEAPTVFTADGQTEAQARDGVYQQCLAWASSQGRSRSFCMPELGAIPMCNTQR